MVKWVTTYHKKSTDGKSETIHCELRLNFSTSRWNDKDMSPVIKLIFYDYKVERTWDDEKYKLPPIKKCTMQFPYFQRMPEVNKHSNVFNYNRFTLEKCKKTATKLFKKRLKDVLNQL